MGHPRPPGLIAPAVLLKKTNLFYSLPPASVKEIMQVLNSIPAHIEKGGAPLSGHTAAIYLW